MPVPTLTPEQAAAVRDHMSRVTELFRQLADAIREQMRRAAPAIRAMAEYVEALHAGVRPVADPLGLAFHAAAGTRTRTRMAAQARPAWVSPYGPAHHRR